MSDKLFSDINLSKDVRRGIEAVGFEEMTPIQAQAIPVIMDGKDIIGQAQTGTGKTAAFAIPALEKVDGSNPSVQALILCPTRELCIQVAKEIGNIGRHVKGLYVLPIYGGQPINRQIRSLQRGVQIVVGTPGRVIDHINRGTLKLGNVNMMVLDEADEMFDMGFREDISLVMNKLADERQTIFFSATMPKEIINFASRYQNNPEIIKVAHKELTMPNIEQYYFDIKEHAKTEALCRLVDIHNPRLAVVFCNTKRKVDALTGALQSRGYFVDSLHGDLNQNQRDTVMDKFRKGTIDILVATDVAARGIDVDEVDIVFNFDLPQDEEYYVHRIGRTARAGREGIAFSFVTNRDRNKLNTIKRYTKADIARKDIPTLHDVEVLQEDTFVDEIKKVLDKKEYTKHQEVLNKIMEEGYGPYEIASALIQMRMDASSKDKYEVIENMEETSRGRQRNDRNDKRRNDRNDRGGKNRGKKSIGDATRVYINVGKNKGVGPANILAAIIQETGISKDSVGSIDIYDKFSFVDIDKNDGQTVIEKLNGKKINRVKVLVEETNSRR